MAYADEIKIVKCYQGAANAVDCDVLNLGDFHKATLVVIHTGASDTDLVLSLYESDDVSKSNTAAITTACPLWVDSDMGTSSDVLVRQTDAYSYTIDTGEAPNQMVVWEVDPAIMSDGYKCLYISDSGGNASNTVSIVALLEPRYKSDSLPAAIS
jgi:hypothetical protein